jgi:hypothetical protein
LEFPSFFMFRPFSPSVLVLTSGQILFSLINYFTSENAFIEIIDAKKPFLAESYVYSIPEGIDTIVRLLPESCFSLYDIL